MLPYRAPIAGAAAGVMAARRREAALGLMATPRTFLPRKRARNHTWFLVVVVVAVVLMVVAVVVVMVVMVVVTVEVAMIAVVVVVVMVVVMGRG